MYLLSLVMFLLSLVFSPAGVDNFMGVNPVRVAARCKGEASFAVAGCACTVVERLEAGWNPAKVLNAYYAGDSRPTEEDVAVVQSVLSGRVDCIDGMYYMFSASDTNYLHLDRDKATVSVSDKGREIYFYPKDALKRGSDQWE